MKKTHLLVLLLSLLLAVVFVGCEGEQGPDGPQGEPGPPGEDATAVVYTFLGNMGEDCMHCHSSTVSQWESTGHVNAFDNLDAESQLRPYCVQCHTTGWDATVAYTDTIVTTPGPDVYGYDDYFKVDSEEAEMRRHALEGVQCEACHGAMGPDFNAHKPAISFSTHNDADGNSTSTCSPCHSGQLEEWLVSGHGNVVDADIEVFNEEHYAHNSSCDFCHTSEGFIREHDPRYADYEFPEEQSFIGCVTCHDPHSAGNTYQIRDLGDEPIMYVEDDEADVPTMSGFGTGQVCVQCHHARRDYDNVTGQIESGSSHFGPHGSPQMDMFIGYGSYELADYTYDRLNDGFNHNNVDNGCVGCHMVREAEVHGEVQEHSFHTFEPEFGSCEGCHTDMTDIEGLRSGLITEIEEKLDAIAVLCGYTDHLDFETNWDSDNSGKERWQREVGYAAMFVLEDGSMGTHNPTYAKSLLDNAITYGNAQAR